MPASAASDALAEARRPRTAPWRNGPAPADTGVAGPERDRLTSAPVSIGDLALGRDTLAMVGALEIAVHGWDVARAVGSGRQIPEDLAARLYDVAQLVVTTEERGTRFAEPVPVPHDASFSTRLLAHLGRRGG